MDRLLLSLCVLTSHLGEGVPLALGKDADFGHWFLPCMYAVSSPCPRSPRGPGCLGKELDEGREGAGRQVRASRDHVILLSAGNLLFLVNMSAGSDSHCCAVEALGECAACPAATCIITGLNITLIISS